MNSDLIQAYILDFQKRALIHLTQRDLELPSLRESAVAIVGARRSGKTYRTYQFVNELEATGVSRQCVCRIQFNDLRLQNINREVLPLIEDAYYALYPQFRNTQDVYFIFDEIHRIDGWEDFVLGLLDNPRHRVLITGSTAKIRTGEIASALRGKCFTRQLHPFSFREFIRHLNIPDDGISFSGKDSLKNAFKRYSLQGGYPGLFLCDQSMHTEQLQSYWETMLLRDILEAHPTESINSELLLRFSQGLVSRIGCPVTIRKMVTNMKEAHFSFSAETLYKYVRYLNEAFALSMVDFYSPSEAVRNRNYSKVYANDWALAAAVSIGEPHDITRLFENMVFVELQRRGNALSYYRTRQGHEVDFVARDANGGVHLYQVCYEISQESQKRELRSLVESYDFLNAKSATIVTANNEELLTLGSYVIRIVPAWKWFLGKD